MLVYLWFQELIWCITYLYLWCRQWIPHEESNHCYPYPFYGINLWDVIFYDSWISRTVKKVSMKWTFHVWRYLLMYTLFLQSSQLNWRTRSTSCKYMRCSCKRRCRSHANIHTWRHLSQRSLARGERNSASATLALLQVI